MPSLLKQSDLMEWLGFSRAADVESWLRKRKVPYQYGRGKQIVTTLEAVNAALLKDSPGQERQFGT